MEEVTCIEIVDDQEYLDTLEADYRTYRDSGAKPPDEINTVPICFHVIHTGEEYGSGSNIRDEQIHMAVNGLNEDFSKEIGTWGDGNGAASNLRFVLMNKDDEGNPTSGIYRVNGAALSAAYAADGVRSQTANGELASVVKSWSNQDNQHVYNIWIVSKIDGSNGSGVQGFSHYPTTGAHDGIVQLYNATGKLPPNFPSPPPFNIVLKSYTNRNRVLTHEMGHAMNLRHTFIGNSCTEIDCSTQGDFVCDTPPTEENPNGNNPACGGTQQVENYMDYTQQHFKDMFTQGQVDRMQFAYTYSRPNLVTSEAIDNLSLLVATAALEIITPATIQCPNPTTAIRIKITNTSAVRIDIVEFEYTANGSTVTYKWYGAISPQGNGTDYDYITIARVPVTSSGTVSVEIVAINGNATSVTESVSVIVPVNGPYTVEIVSDILQGQVSWVITDAVTEDVVYQGELLPNFEEYTNTIKSVCLPDGDYVFTVVDTMDGMSTEGSYVRLKDSSGTVLVTAQGTDPNTVFPFTVGGGEPTSSEMKPPLFVIY